MQSTGIHNGTVGFEAGSEREAERACGRGHRSEMGSDMAVSAQFGRLGVRGADAIDEIVPDDPCEDSALCHELAALLGDVSARNARAATGEGAKTRMGRTTGRPWAVQRGTAVAVATGSGSCNGSDQDGPVSEGAARGIVAEKRRRQQTAAGAAAQLGCDRKWCCKCGRCGAAVAGVARGCCSFAASPTLQGGIHAVP